MYAAAKCSLRAVRADCMHGPGSLHLQPEQVSFFEERCRLFLPTQTRRHYAHRTALYSTAPIATPMRHGSWVRRGASVLGARHKTMLAASHSLSVTDMSQPHRFKHIQHTIVLQCAFQVLLCGEPTCLVSWVECCPQASFLETRQLL